MTETALTYHPVAEDGGSQWSDPLLDAMLRAGLVDQLLEQRGVPSERRESTRRAIERALAEGGADDGGADELRLEAAAVLLGTASRLSDLERRAARGGHAGLVRRLRAAHESTHAWGLGLGGWRP